MRHFSHRLLCFVHKSGFCPNKSEQKPSFFVVVYKYGRNFAADINNADVVKHQNKFFGILSILS